MRIITYFLVLSLIYSCYGDVTFTNEVKEKDKGMHIANRFYKSKELLNQQDTILVKAILSNEFLKEVPVSVLLDSLYSQRVKYGKVKDYELYSWNTLRKTGSNKYWECKLSFHVYYENVKRDEDLILIKNNDSIRILYYGM